MTDKIKLIKRIYNAQRSSSKKRGHEMPNYSVDELIRWFTVEQCENFNNMYNKWVESGFNSKLKPSIDRIQNSLPYTFSNIQLMTWGDNDKKAHLDSISGAILTGKDKKPVYKISQFGFTICLYQSINIASRDTGIDDSSIIKCCNKKVKTAGDFVWRYYDENK